MPYIREGCFTAEVLVGPKCYIKVYKGNCFDVILNSTFDVEYVLWLIIAFVYLSRQRPTTSRANCFIETCAPVRTPYLLLYLS